MGYDMIGRDGMGWVGWDGMERDRMMRRDEDRMG